MELLANEAVKMGVPSQPLERPTTTYVKGMDCLLFLREDCSYRADRVDVYLTVLWHPHEQRLVGIKLKGCSFLFRQIMKAMSLTEDSVIRLVSVLELVLLAGFAEVIIHDHETKGRDRLERLYSEARGVAADAEINLREVFERAA